MDERLRQQRREASKRYNDKMKALRLKNGGVNITEAKPHSKDHKHNSHNSKLIQQALNGIQRLTADVEHLHSKLDGIMNEMGLEEVSESDNESNQSDQSESDQSDTSSDEDE